jgi:hypothetical protein
MADNNRETGSFLRRNIVFLAILVAIVLAAVSARIFIDVLPPIIKPSPTPPPTSTSTTVVKDVTIANIRAMAELATIEYKAVAEIQNERVPDDVRKYLGVKEQIILLAYGDVKAGFDLEKLTGDDLWTDGTRVQLHLPPPEILSTSIDYERTHVVYHQKTLLISQDIDWEGEIFEIAEEAIRQEAVQGEILENAAKYGQLFFENFLYSLGFTEVQVIVN